MSGVCLSEAGAIDRIESRGHRQRGEPPVDRTVKARHAA
jgi:hypothetical protein